MVSLPIAVGVDVGGSKIVLGLVHPDGSVSAETRIPTTNRDPDWVTDTIVTWAKENGRGLPVGVAAAGAADNDGVLHFGSFIRWDGYPLQARLAERLGVPTFVQNDVTVAAWGEYNLDPAKRSVAVIAAGTGVGGGAVSDGVLLTGRGAAMEIGHLPVSKGVTLCTCGKVGCLETVASGSAVEHRYHSRRMLAKLDAPGSMTPAPAIVTAAHDGDRIAIEVLQDAGEALGEAAALISAVLDSERIVLTGGLVHGAPDVILQAGRHAFADHVRLPGRANLSTVEVSTATSNPILVGAAFLAADHTFRPSPTALDDVPA